MRLSRALLSLVVAAVVSCDSLESPDEAAIALYLDMSATTVPLGGSVDVTVIARNVGTQPLILTGPSDCLLYIQVYSQDSQRVYTSAATCTGPIVEEEVAPGDTRTASLQWAGTNMAGTRLPPGIYHLNPVALLPGGAWTQPGANVAVE